MAAENGEMTALLRKLIGSLEQQNEQKDELIRQKDEQIAHLEEQIAQLNQTVANLNETVLEFQRKLFGTSSEKTPADAFNEAEAEQDPSEEDPPVETVVGGYTRARRTKKKKATYEELMSGLPVEELKCYVAEEDRVCDWCGHEMVHAGWKKVREEVQIIPAQVKRILVMQEVVECPACKKDKASLKTALTPSPLMPHSYATASTVAYVMYMKYVMFAPLYRQEMDWKEKGVILNRTTMANWVIYCAMNYMKPVYERLHSELLRRDMIHADEVPCQVLHEDGRTARQKSYFWVYLSIEDDLPGIILYDYTPGRNGDYAADFLNGFNGYVHCDGYSGYNKLKEIVRVGCFAHCRRYFFEAIPKKTTGGTSAAEVGYEYCNRLFQLEREYKDLPSKEKKAAREKYEKPILDEFFDWVDRQEPVGGSRFDKAITYARKQKENLMNYLLDGRLELSNNSAERRVKSYVMGRKNFLFHNTANGAEASAIVYSLVESAKANNINVFEYLQTVLLYMPDYKNEPAGIEDMLPWSDFIKERCSADRKREFNKEN